MIASLLLLRELKRLKVYCCCGFLFDTNCVLAETSKSEITHFTVTISISRRHQR